VASFFVSRVDTEVDKRLEKLGGDAERLVGKAAVANAGLAYRRYEAVFASDRWRTLADAGARPQRPLWASTSTKNPAYRDVVYVEGLIAPGVVNTMPAATVEAYADHGQTTADTVTPHYQDAQQVFEELTRAGVDLDDVVDVLEREGVEKFAASWAELLGSVERQLNAVSAASGNQESVIQPTETEGASR
jgi:transaldolase